MSIILILTLMALTTADYERCARRIANALKLQPGETVLLKVDPRVFAPIIQPLQQEIRKAGAFIAGTILSESATSTSDGELDAMRRLFNSADVFIWLPEIRQANTPAVARALVEWLDARRGRAVHFHWGSGTYPVGDAPLPTEDLVDRMYLTALDVSPADLDRMHDRVISVLRSGTVRVTTPEGTDIRFVVGDRPFSKQIGDASRDRMQSARIRIDRDVELPAGVLRVAPIETSANGTVVLAVWRPIRSEGRNIRLTFVDGRVTKIEGNNAATIDRELTEAGGDAKMFREFALGFNPALRVPNDRPFIPYYAYGGGAVRLSLGDNEEMGGANRGGGVYWNFLHNATVTVGDRVLVKDGELVP